MTGAPRRAHLEDIVIIAGLIGMQLIYAGNSVLVSYLMLLGFTPASLIILSSLATSVILSPFSVIFERYGSILHLYRQILVRIWANDTCVFTYGTGGYGQENSV